MVADLLAQVGVSAAAALAAVWSAITFLGKGWVDNRLKIQVADFEARKNQELEALKNEQAKQIEALRYNLDLLRNRFEKLHDQEFIVLPEVWSRMAEAMGTMIAASDPLRDFPSTIGMNEGELEEYLQDAPLLAWEKGAIKDFPRERQQERDASLHNMLDWANYRRARTLTEAFRDFVQSRRIFMSRELTGELDKVVETLEQATAEFRRFLEGRQGGHPIDLVICPKLKSESVRLASAVQDEIRKKLYGDP